MFFEILIFFFTFSSQHRKLPAGPRELRAPAQVRERPWTPVRASQQGLASRRGCQGCRVGGSWVVISGVISRVTILIAHIRGLITLLTTTHEPPRRGCQGVKSEAFRI